MPDESCPQKRYLTDRTQAILADICELARAEQAAVESNDQPLIMAIDKKIENAIGEKERAIGAFKQHVSEHGC